MADQRANIIYQLVDNVTAGLQKMNAGMVANQQKMKASYGAIAQSAQIMGAAVVAAFAGIIWQATAYGDAINTASEKTGVSTEALSGLKYAVEQSDGSFDSLIKGLSIMNMKLVDAAKGSDMAMDSFRKFGIEAVDPVTGMVKTADQVLIELAGNFEKGKMSAQELEAAAKSLAGRGGSDLVPFLKQGASGIQAMMEKAQALGIILDKETAEALDQFRHDLDTTKQQLAGVGIQITMALLPALNWMIGVMSSAIKYFKLAQVETEMYGRTVVRVADIIINAMKLAANPFMGGEKKKGLVDQMKADYEALGGIAKDANDKRAKINEDFLKQEALRQKLANREKLKGAVETQVEESDSAKKKAAETAKEVKKEWEGAYFDLEKEGEKFIDSFIDIWTKSGSNLADIFRDMGKTFQVEFIRAGLEPLKTQLGLFMGEMKSNIGDMVSGLGGLFGGNNLLGGLLGGALTGGIGSLLGGIVEGIFSSFQEVPHWGDMALESMAKAADQVTRLWGNAVNMLDRNLGKLETGQDLWKRMFEGKAEGTKMDISILGIPGLQGFVTYAEGLQAVMISHMNALAGLSEAEETELEKKKKVRDVLAEYAATYEKLRDLPFILQGSEMGQGLKDQMAALAEAYEAATGEQIPAMEDLAAALADAQTEYSKAINAYSSGNLSQEELIKIMDDMKALQEATGMTNEQIAALMNDQIKQMVESGKLTALQAEALRASLGISEGVRDALKAQSLATLQANGISGLTIEQLKAQVEAMGLLMDSEGNITDSNGVLYGKVDLLGTKFQGLTTVSDLLRSGEQKLTDSNNKLISSVDNLRRAIETLNIPPAALGGAVVRSGLAYIHQGENIIPKGSNGFTGDLNLSVVINGGTTGGNMASNFEQQVRNTIMPMIKKELARYV